jgi:hypothetical protein
MTHAAHQFPQAGARRTGKWLPTWRRSWMWKPE